MKFKQSALIEIERQMLFYFLQSSRSWRWRYQRQARLVLPWKCFCGSNAMWWPWWHSLYRVSQKSLRWSGQGKEKAHLLKMPCQRSSGKKQSRRREGFTGICSWSLLRSSLRQGAFSFPCPVYCRLFLGHPELCTFIYIVNRVVSGETYTDGKKFYTAGMDKSRP